MTAVLTDRRRSGVQVVVDGRDGPYLALYRPGAPDRGGVVGETRQAASRTVTTGTIGGRRVNPHQPLDRGVYRRRRLLAGGLLLLSVAAVLVVAQFIQAGIGGGPLTTTGAAAVAGGLTPARATVYVVRPGDTLWSIAAALEPGRDERPLVDQLAQEAGGASLYPGQTLVMTGRR
jgi:hypothetical protein